MRCAARYAGLNVGSALVLALDEVSTRLAFQSLGAPDLPLGQEIELSMQIDDQLIDRFACVRARRDAVAERVYELGLIQTKALREDLRSALSRSFNLRGAFRVTPLESAPVVGEICGLHSNFRTAVTVEDISATGLAGKSAVDAEEELCRVTEVQLSLVLQPGAAPVSLVASIVGRELNGSGIRYRFAFHEPTAHRCSELAKVMDYIMSRQRQLAAATNR